MVLGCLFHWCQALLKHFKEDLGAKIAATQMDWFRRLCVLALVPPENQDLIDQYFGDLLTSIPVQYAAKYRKFTDYFVRTYFEGNFPIKVWNHFHSVGVPRTNNHLEGYNNKLKKFVGLAHPDIYRAIEVFKGEENTHTQIFTQTRLDMIKPPPRRKLYIINSELYRTYRDMFLKQEITFETFVIRVIEQFDFDKDARVAEQLEEREEEVDSDYDSMDENEFEED